MGNILLLFLVLFPMLLSAWVFPLRRRDRRYRNWLIQIIPAVELAARITPWSCRGSLALACGFRPGVWGACWRW